MDSKCFITQNLFVLGVCNIKDNFKKVLKHLFKRVQVNSYRSLWGPVAVAL
jgi:hypothetical protein